MQKFMKRKLFLLSLIAFVLALVIAGCQREGCTDSKATNYDPDAKNDNGTCVYATPEPEPTPVVPTKEITIDFDFFDNWGNINKDTVKKYTDMEDVKFLFLNIVNEDGGRQTSGLTTDLFHSVRGDLQTRFDISPKVRGGWGFTPYQILPDCDSINIGVMGMIRSDSAQFSNWHYGVYPVISNKSGK